MKLSKKKEKEFSAKIAEIKELEKQKKDAENRIDELKGDIKNYMDKNKTSEIQVGVFTVHYADYVSERFDSKAFEESYSELYGQFIKKISSKRFSIT